MPGSVKTGKEEIKRFIESQDDILTIIDVGAGSGTYRKLLGDKYQWVAVEIFEPYIEKFGLNELYDQIIVDDIRNFQPNHYEAPLENYCIIFGDVIEHLPKDDALDVLKYAIISYKHVVVSIPIGHYPAEIHYGNEHEAHISEWSFDEIEKLADWKETYLSKQIGIFCL